MMNADATQGVLSASRRTDIPAFYMDWFMAGIRRGFFEVVNPYNGRQKTIACGPDRIHTIVFWSKNLGPFLAGGYGEKLRQAGYHLFFNFTVNSADRLLEPHLPPLPQRLRQITDLAQRFEGRRINWRFDPICFYRRAGGGLQHNLADFETIADTAAAAGLSRCITSFMDMYQKIERRVAARDITFEAPSREKQREVVQHLAKQLHKKQMKLYLCCEKALLADLPADSTIRAAACVPNDLFVQFDGGSLSVRKDSGQRRAAGCGCRISQDIGDYRRHPCYHNCLFCYANPQPPENRP